MKAAPAVPMTMCTVAWGFSCKWTGPEEVCTYGIESRFDIGANEFILNKDQSGRLDDGFVQYGRVPLHGVIVAVEG